MFSLAVLRQAASKTATSRRWISKTRIALEKKIVVVPTMGDSITEGTIVEWTVGVGQSVKADDVVALVETDKVTIEIKAVADGVLTQQFGSLDKTVAVGAKLYEIDTEATATATTAESSAASTSSQESNSETTSTTNKKELSSPTTVSPSPVPHSARDSSIHFLGKEGWAARKSGQKQQSQAVVSVAPAKPHGVTVVQDDGAVRHPMYGRPPFSEEEMEALIWGGANLVADWKVKQ